MSCIEKKYSKQKSLNFDDKKYIGTVSASVSVSQYCTRSPMPGHQKIIALHPTMNHSLWIIYIARKDCSLYNK